MDISFVILTWNSAEYIEKCIETVMSTVSTDKLHCEIFIVDNGSHDETITIVKSFGVKNPGLINLIQLDHNTGTTYSRNLALKKVIGKYVAVIDSDIELKDDGLSRLINVIEADDNIGLAVPRLLYPSGMLQKSTDRFPTVFNKISRYFFLKLQEKHENQKEIVGRDVDYAISAFWVLRRDILLEVGLLDESIFYAPEDVDYCLRIWKAGYRIIYVPEVTAIHHAQEISRGFEINKATLLHIHGLIYFFKKHKYWLVKPRFR